MWKLEILNAGEIVDEKEVNYVMAAELYVMNESGPNRVPGFAAHDKDDHIVELVGGHEQPSMIFNQEGFVCIRGLWIHRREGEIAGETGLYYGVENEDGTFTEASKLGEGLDDLRLQREWRLEPSLSGEELLESGQAPGYAGSD